MYKLVWRITGDTVGKYYHKQDAIEEANKLQEYETAYPEKFQAADDLEILEITETVVEVIKGVRL
jgi:hypothetical protein